MHYKHMEEFEFSRDNLDLTHKPFIDIFYKGQLVKYGSLDIDREESYRDFQINTIIKYCLLEPEFLRKHNILYRKLEFYNKKIEVNLSYK
ncbi:MAG: hypothetical protein JXQ66_03895 [Campylobacterales bacterium]|nr:hypothetical protein [Campylobacterales bacterium]